MAQKKSRHIAARDVIGIDEVKRWLRRALIRKRQRTSSVDRAKWNRQAVAHFIRSPVYKRSKTLAVFLGFGSEIATNGLVSYAWKRGKTVLIPMASQGFHKPYFALFQKGDRLRKTSFGPKELVKQKKPFNFRRVDVVVVPGLGFDYRGYRLGYGGGVYDRILLETPRAKHVGLFFANQQMPVIPRDGYDKKMHVIITEKGILIPII